MSKASLLRFMTAGSVDDGKSTLIGRLLYDSKAVFDDQLETLEADEDWEAKLANLLDGLKAEREQGITIDVAYRYFATPKRKFIIADSPGHVQYTRNMVTAASTASLAVMLVDARKGINEQTRRHAYISSLLRIPHFAVCINKMDLVDYSEETYNAICREFTELSSKFVDQASRETKIEFIPISALKGDNVVTRSKNMPWYSGNSFLEHLENVVVEDETNPKDARFPVQYVIRPRDDKHHDFRGYAGRILDGELSVGQEVTVLPSGKTSKIKEIFVSLESVKKAFSPMAATILLDDEIDIGRGDTIVPSESLPEVSDKLRAKVCWMSEDALWPNRKYIIKLGTACTKAIVRSIDTRLNVETLEEEAGAGELKLNDIGDVQFQLASKIALENFAKSKGLGGFIIIDEVSNSTVGAGLVLSASEGNKKIADYNI